MNDDDHSYYSLTLGRSGLGAKVALIDLEINCIMKPEILPIRYVHL